MCTKLRELEEALASFAGDFDAAVISAAEAEVVMERAARIEHMGATLKALAAARVAQTELWATGGDKSPAHMLARRTGGTVSGAAAELEAARKLACHPRTNAAARKGTLSPQQAAAITDAASADPKAEADLLDLAERASLGELRDEAARRKAAATDVDEQHRQIHAQRHLRSWTGPDGAWNLSAKGTPDAGARLMARLQTIADELFNQARREGRHEPTEAY